MGLAFFSYDEMRIMTGNPQFDSHGSRVGLNLIGGVTFATDWPTPFVPVRTRPSNRTTFRSRSAVVSCTH